jgi:hypothetical protein
MSNLVSRVLILAPRLRAQDPGYEVGSLHDIRRPIRFEIFSNVSLSGIVPIANPIFHAA